MTDVNVTANTNIDANVEAGAAYEQSLADVRTELGKAQGTYKKLRGHRALGTVVATSFKGGMMFLKSSADVQALILSQHQVNMNGEVNRFSPWIAASCGEEDLNGEKVQAIDGKEYPKWVPDANMKRYFHTMEGLVAAGFDESSDITSMVDWIMKQGGSQSIVKNRQKAANEASKPDREKKEKAARELYLKDGPCAAIDIDTNAIKLGDVKQFFTLLVEKGEDGSFIVRGVGETDASAKLKKLAETAYPQLKLEADAYEKALATVRAEQNGIASGTVNMPSGMKNAKAAKQPVEQN